MELSSHERLGRRKPEYGACTVLAPCHAGIGIGLANACRLVHGGYAVKILIPSEPGRDWVDSINPIGATA